MDKAVFWRLIAQSKKRSNADLEVQAETLGELVAALPAKAIIEYSDIVTELEQEAFSWDLWAAAYIINRGCSDDCFEYFRDWLIMQGEDFFNRTVANPESLVDAPIDVDDPVIEFEGLFMMALEAYEAKTGKEMPYPARAGFNNEPSGEQWDENNVHNKYPRLAAKFS